MDKVTNFEVRNPFVHLFLISEDSYPWKFNMASNTRYQKHGIKGIGMLMLLMVLYRHLQFLFVFSSRWCILGNELLEYTSQMFEQ